MIRVFQIACAKRLRNFRVQRVKQTSAKDRRSIEKNAAQADSADRLRAVAHVTDHDGVHNSHRHPPNLGKHQRPRQREHRRRLSSKLANKIAEHITMKAQREEKTEPARSEEHT